MHIAVLCRERQRNPKTNVIMPLRTACFMRVCRLDNGHVINVDQESTIRSSMKRKQVEPSLHIFLLKGI